jgi:hypothetical protein
VLAAVEERAFPLHRQQSRQNRESARLQKRQLRED